MLQMRKNVFETNSSSTHSITMCTQDEYDAWAHGKLLLNDGWWSKDNESEFKDKKFVTREEAKDIMAHNDWYMENVNEGKLKPFDELDDEALADYELYTPDYYPDENSSLEWFEETYTTPSGETVVAFGLYGTDY